MNMPESWNGFYELFQRHQQLGLAASEVEDPKTRRVVLREQSKLGRELAEMLGTPQGSKVVPLPAPQEGAIRPVVRVSGLPSKIGRAQAEKWMAENGIGWDGSIDVLRSEISNAFGRGEDIPNGRFDGLRVEWTIEVDTSTYWKTMMAFSMAERGTVPAPLTLRPPRS